VDTRTLVDAWGECVTLGLVDTLGDRNHFRCVRVFEELDFRRAAVVTSMYGEPLAQVRSCEQAVAFVDTAESALGPLSVGSRYHDREVVNDVGVIPAWTRLHAIRTGRYEDVVSGIDLDDLAVHAKMLLECHAGPALARLLAVYETDRSGSPAPPSAPPTAGFAAQLVDANLSDAFAVADRAEAPPLIATALARRSRPAACPSTEAGVVALLRDPSPAPRMLGCDCVDGLPSGMRADAARLRVRLVHYDGAQHSVEVARGAVPPAVAVDGPAAVPLAVPLIVGGLASALGPSHRTERSFPVRDACQRAAPPWEVAPDRVVEPPTVEILAIETSGAASSIRIAVFVREPPSSVGLALVSVDGDGAPDGRFCASTSSAARALACRETVVVSRANPLGDDSNIQVLRDVELPSTIRRVRVEIIEDDRGPGNADPLLASPSFAVPPRKAGD
jgi:hypothetical protein